MRATRRLKGEALYFSKILVRAPEIATFGKMSRFDIFSDYQERSRNFWRACARECARTRIFEKYEVSAFKRRVARISTTLTVNSPPPPTGLFSSNPRNPRTVVRTKPPYVYIVFKYCM